MADRVNSEAGALLYLYGITATSVSLPATLRGVDEAAPVKSLESSGFVCWVSRVNRREFGDELARNMENLEWLAEASVRHQQVVAAIYEKEDILPARFGTVFASEESLKADVARRKGALLAGFRRVTGADEWGVRVFAMPGAVAVATTARSGKEYLQRKSALMQARPSRTLEPEIKEFAAALDEIATASTEGGKVGAGQPRLRWQASLLVPRARRKKLDVLLARFSHEWREQYRVECTGPWPPYSFVTDQGQSRGAA